MAKKKRKQPAARKQPGVWGIDLGQCALKAVRLEMKDGEVTATAFDYIEHPKILSQPDADPDQLTREALEGFLKRNDLRGDLIIISVPGQSGLARFVKLPPVEEKKIDAIVTFEAKQQIPFPLEEVVWDYQRVGKGTVSDGFALETEVGLFAMKRDMVNRALQQFKDVNVEVHVVQMAPLALCNFVVFDQLHKDINAPDGAEEPASKECVVSLDIGADNSNLVITDGDRIIWQRPIPLGGNHFTRALTKEMKLTFAKAEHIKRNAIKSPDLRKILTALRPVLNDFVNEVQRSLGYFTNTHRGAVVGHMLGMGNVFRLPGLQKFLEEKLQLEVRKLARFERLRGDAVVNAPQFSENIMSFAIAYGLALQGLKVVRLQTNLLPKEIRLERLVRAKKPWAVAAAAALVLAIGGLTFGRSIQWNIVSPDRNPAVRDALKSQEEAIKLEGETRAAYTKHESAAKASEVAVTHILSSPDDRLNWMLVYKYINDCLPRANGSRLADDTEGEGLTSNHPFRDYWLQNTNAQNAYRHWVNLRNPEPGAAPPKPILDPKKRQQEEEKKREEDAKNLMNLVQINVEGISSWYCDDLNAYFGNLVENTQSFEAWKGWMHERDKQTIMNKKDENGKALPTKGWVFEIRGYTFHTERQDFIKNTLCANLRNPDKMILGVSKKDQGRLQHYSLDTEGLKERVKDRMGFVCLYDYTVVKSPVPGEFSLIAKSALKDLTTSGGEMAGFSPPPGDKKDPGKGPGKVAGSGGKGPTGGGAGKGAGRDGWTPLGDVAASTIGTKKGPGPGIPSGMPQGSTQPPTGGESLVDGPPRTEFVVLFVWQEPFTKDQPAAAGKTTPAQK